MMTSLADVLELYVRDQVAQEFAHIMRVTDPALPREDPRR
jgi:hypothetical protein